MKAKIWLAILVDTDKPKNTCVLEVLGGYRNKALERFSEIGKEWNDNPDFTIVLDSIMVEQ